MDASRIKAARRRLWRAWVFGGLIWSIAFMGMAAAMIWFLGAPGAQTVQLALTLVLVVCGGLYAFVYFGAAFLAVVRWANGRQPK